VVIVAISKLDEGGLQFLKITKPAEPQDLFFEGAKEALDASVGLGRQLHRMATVQTVLLKFSIYIIH
jgi:hypothetical protein